MRSFRAFLRFWISNSITRAYRKNNVTYLDSSRLGYNQEKKNTLDDPHPGYLIYFNLSIANARKSQKSEEISIKPSEDGVRQAGRQAGHHSAGAFFPCFLDRRIQMHAAVEIVKGTAVRYAFFWIDFARQCMCVCVWVGLGLAVTIYPGHEVGHEVDREVARGVDCEVAHEVGGRLGVK